MQLKELIEDIMRIDPELRDDDKSLLLEVWRRQGLRLDDPQKKFIQDFGTNPESVRRTRQKIQEEGHLWPEKKQQTFC